MAVSNACKLSKLEMQAESLVSDANFNLKDDTYCIYIVYNTLTTPCGLYYHHRRRHQFQAPIAQSDEDLVL